MKRIITILLVLLTLMMSSVAFATEPVILAIEGAKKTDDITYRAEELEWFYRKNEDGTWQRRLWSYTQGKWLTEWEYV